MPKYDIPVRPVDGNAFAIMGAVTAALKKHGVPRTEIEAYMEEAMSSRNYNLLLQVSLKWVNLQPTNGVEGNEEEDDEDDEEEYDFS